MARLTPGLKCLNAREQAAFYVEALGGEVLSVVTADQVPGMTGGGDKVAHMAIRVADALLYMDDFPFEQAQAEARGDVCLTLEFAEAADAHTAFERLGAGGHVDMALALAPWGTLYGQLRDRFGVVWAILTEPSSAGANGSA